MNKDVIYIEPEDDITDILAKLKQSSQKVVALVPPKKASVLRSAVNVKLVAKSAKAAEKAAVIVTTDPSLVKLAATAKVPVAKNLQSRPEIPTAEALAAGMAAEQVIEEDLSDKDATAKDAKSQEKSANDRTKGEEKGTKDKKDVEDKSKNGQKDKKKKVPSLDKKRKWIIIGVIGVVVIAGLLVWAFVFAPSAKVIVGVKTSGENFAENVSLLTSGVSGDIEGGKLPVEEQKSEQKSSAQFTATGRKDVGTKARGTLAISTAFHNAGTVGVPAGTTFIYNGLRYIATGGASLSWDGNEERVKTDCEAGSGISAGCIKSTTISVEAAENGEKYNMGSQSSGWSASIGNITVQNTSGISGGTDKVITVVQQADVDKAKANLSSGDAEDAKKELAKQFKDGVFVIGESFNKIEGAAISTPAVGEEVKDGTTPTVSLTVGYTMLGVKNEDIEKFVKAKMSVPDDQKVYSVGNPSFERISEVEKGIYAARLKTTPQIGPKITEDDIMDKVKGKKVGEVQSLLKSINGVENVEVKTSFFWVGSVPNDEKKVQIELTVSQ